MGGEGEAVAQRNVRHGKLQGSRSDEESDNQQQQARQEIAQQRSIERNHRCILRRIRELRRGEKKPRTTLGGKEKLHRPVESKSSCDAHRSPRGYLEHRMNPSSQSDASSNHQRPDRPHLRSLLRQNPLPRGARIHCVVSPAD